MEETAIIAENLATKQTIALRKVRRVAKVVTVRMMVKESSMAPVILVTNKDTSQKISGMMKETRTSCQNGTSPRKRQAWLQ